MREKVENCIVKEKRADDWIDIWWGNANGPMENGEDSWERGFSTTFRQQSTNHQGSLRNLPQSGTGMDCETSGLRRHSGRRSAIIGGTDPTTATHLVCVSDFIVLFHRFCLAAARRNRSRRAYRWVNPDEVN
ncbi:unnamed protein product [Strongylus vulgaris]|uniref:Uncharacterized protein n=1 Tax=Strongylus vulgaris TaxID=40348 RepID=A0A3P7IXC2_STRVU|nr:unnamed protein product [Strongylus vulgaris]